MDDVGKVIGEARRYDPYSKFGDIMLYEIDSFGFVPGFIKKGLRLMSEEDLMSDESLRRSLEAAKYDCWKRYNIIDLIAEYDRMFKDKNHFDRFCKIIYKDILEKEIEKQKNNESL
ncbi:hypothetical protein [Candidatus Nitrosotenuis sp. DW1]|uniref:hypothetical protein n=1 Tax=Candidatus Nitrosotenuis sp. DW1 TaxID=2259672 RepID=UPI0015C879BB|nr:hypothetical protein [Candidatus Nitrosotenuis sp. DW1]QLH08570.1 hypothetical protein DSQ19_02940 [Candidatus Nitrosotenuis sp. DW1]